MPLFLALISFCVSGQVKIEKELRVNEDAVPAPALKWFSDAFPGARKVKWYKEENPDKTNYESKHKWNGYWHSVEFNSDGVIEDVEIDIPWKDLADETQDNLSAYLDSTYTRHKIQKIQRQYTGTPSVIQNRIKTGSLKGVTVRFEIEFYGKNEIEDELWEGLFTDKGELIQRRRVVVSSTNNIIY